MGELNARQLARSLVAYLKQNEWVAVTELWSSGHDMRVDVAAIRAYRYSPFHLRAFEIKVNRSDFLNDVRSGKYQKYFNIFHQVYFACEEGLIKKEEVPSDAGLITLGNHYFLETKKRGEEWKMIKGAKKHNPSWLDHRHLGDKTVTILNQVVMSILFRLYTEQQVLKAEIRGMMR